METDKSRSQRPTDDVGWRAVTGALLCEELAKRNRWFVFAFGAASALDSIYMLWHHVWILALAGAVWSSVALQRWWPKRHLTKRDCERKWCEVMR